MKFFRLDLLTLLISLFILNGCKNQNTVGIGVATNSTVAGSLVDTATVTTNTVLEDTVISSGLSKNAMGFFTDPVFGTTEADLATDLNLPSSTSYSLPSGTISIDSARLVLRFADGFYGDSLESKYTVNVYQLNEVFQKSATYYNTKVWNYNQNALLGSLTFNARTHDSVKIYDIITGAADTLVKATPQIRIPISTTFINNNFFNASSTALGSNSVFTNMVKGLYITLNKSKTTGPGGIFMLAPADSLTLNVYYKANNGTSIDTASTTLAISATAVHIQHNFTNTIQTELNNTGSSRGTIYLQGLVGLRAKVSFPSLLQNLRAGLLKRDSDIILNRAELVITPIAGSNIPFQPLPKITMYRLDIAHQRIELQDANSTDPRSGGISVFGGFYSPTKQNYHFIITGFLQDMLLNKTIDYGTYISPIDTTNTTSVDINATPQVGARTIAGGGANKSSPYQIKLNIIYTKVAK